MSFEIVRIQSRVSSQPLDAQLISGVAPSDLSVVESEWASERSRILQELLRQDVNREAWPESMHWDWRQKSTELRVHGAQGFGIVCEDQWQGLMLTKATSYFSRVTEGKDAPLVYIDYLETAPWNWVIPELARRGRFRSIGALLFHKAVQLSFQLGFLGRVGLHALPQAEGFYEHGCGMTPLWQDEEKELLMYFELTSIEAARIVGKGA